MSRPTVANENKRKKKAISASDIEWQRYIEAIEQNGENPSKTFRALMDGYIEGRFVPFPRPHKQ